MRRLTGNLVLLVWLAFVWVSLWGSFSVANVLGGLLVAAVLLLVLPLPEVPSQGRARVGALLLFGAVFLWELLKASVTVVAQVLRPRAELQQAVIAVPVRDVSDRLLTLVANAVSLTPGTLALEVDRPRSVLYVHVLHVKGGVDEVEAVRASIVRFERLAVRALGTAEASRRLDEEVAR